MDRRTWIWTFLPTALFGLLAAGMACKANDAANSPASVPPSAAEAPAATATEAQAAAATPESPAPAPAAGSGSESAAPSIYPLTMTRLDGTPGALSSWKGQVLLIVNTASKCGYTPQYEGLQALHAKYAPRGFAVLGFPSNDFGGQEPGSSKEIATFCTSIYAVNFPMFEKTKVIGQERSPLYALLSDAYGPPKWNFHKYLIDKHGRPVQAWPSPVAPGAPEIASAIEAQLALQ
jgi:glutathione peroxidase